MKKQFFRNEHGVAIRMCCASCKMRRLTSDDSRVCKLTGRIVTRTRLCKQWVLAPRLQSAGRSGGRIKSWQYLSYYRERWSAQREAVEAGVQVSLYQKGFLHSKLLVCDDAIATCGSTNLDFRSFENNFEANIFFYDEGIALRMKHLFQKDAAQAVPLEEVPERMKRGFLVRLWESVTRMLSPLF